MALTPKQKIFADEYLIDLNATRAYKVAYPSCKKDEAAAVNGSKLLRNTKVAEYIQERMKDREKRTEITQDWVLEELRKIASANGTDFAHVVREPVIRNNSYVVDPDTGQMQTRDVVRIIPTEELPEECRLPRYLTKPRQRRNEWDMAGSDGISRVSAVFRGKSLLTNKMRII